MNHGDALGGTTYFLASAEVTFPLPGLNQESGFRGAIFADAGTLYGNDVNIRRTRRVTISPATPTCPGGHRWVLRLGIAFGPLRLDYAIPVLKEKHDIEQRLRFGISTQF